MSNLLVPGNIHSDWPALKTISEYIGIFHGTYDSPDETRYLVAPIHRFQKVAGKHFRILYSVRKVARSLVPCKNRLAGHLQNKYTNREKIELNGGKIPEVNIIRIIMQARLI